jgi:hypothetical protein
MFNNPENLFGVNVKIMMRYDVAKFFAPAQSISGYRDKKAPPVISSIFFRLSPIAIKSILTESSFYIPSDESVKKAAF